MLNASVTTGSRRTEKRSKKTHIVPLTAPSYAKSAQTCVFGFTMYVTHCQRFRDTHLSGTPMDGRRGLSLLPRASTHARIPLGVRDTRAPTPQPRPLGRRPPARLPLRDPAEPAKLRVRRSHTGRVSPGKGISPALPRSAPPPRRAMAADDDANVPTPAVSEKTPDAATAPAARARSWAEIASAKDETHRTGPDARAPSATIPEATDRASHPPLAVRSGSASNSSLAPKKIFASKKS